ncbi:MAG: choline-sulfatase [bacterium]|nr:choline-sulfatase [bacterium]
MTSITRPNIVLIMADQMAFDVVGALGHPVVKTPHIDRLAGQGVAFTNCYCNSPLCTPSRASFVTGTLTRRNGVFDNGVELPASAPTIMHLLRCNGYRTILSGKMHFIGPDQLHGFSERLTTDIYPSSMVWSPDWSRGAYHNAGTSVLRLKKSGACRWNMQLEYDEEVLFRTLERIRKLADERERSPFFLCASFTHPHCPFEITPPYWDMYEGVEIPMPAAPGMPLDAMHPYNQWIQVHHGRHLCELTDDEIRANRRSYYGMVSYFDNLVGRVVGELARLDLLENTVIVVTSDHGEMLGEHGMWFKRTYHDPSAKVPLIVHWPGVLTGGRKLDAVVSLVDLSATLLDLGRIADYDEWLAEMDGASLMPLLEGAGADWKNEAICEYYGEGLLHSMTAIIRGGYKYVYVHRHEPLLFDLESDPHETVNLAGRADCAGLRAELHAALTRDWDGDAMDRWVLRSQRHRKMLLASHAARGQGGWGWDYQPFFDASGQYRRDA